MGRSGVKSDIKGSPAREPTGMGSMSSGLSRQLDSSKLTEQELEGHSQLVGNGGVFEGGGLNVS